MDWDEDDVDRTPGVRPLVFSAHDEGRDCRSLFLAPADLPALLGALQPFAAGGTLAVLSPLPAPIGCWPLDGGGWLGPAEALYGLHAPVEALVVRHDVTPREVERHVPASLLACPDHALPVELGARFALILTPEGHAIVLARDQRPLRAVLAGQLEGAAHPVLGHGTPALDEESLDQLIEPIHMADWRRAAFERRQRYRVLRVDTCGEQGCERTRKWVGPLGEGGWRADWSW